MWAAQRGKSLASDGSALNTTLAQPNSAFSINAGSEWSEIASDFSLSTAASAFIAAGVVNKTIPWMDTPDNLYQQLVDDLPAGRVVSYTGYIGFKPNPLGGYDMEMVPYVASPAVAAPNPGSSGSLSTAGGRSNSSS